MIDCHTHAFPGPGPLLAPMVDRLTRAAQVAREILPLKPPAGPPMSVERLAELRRRGPQALLRPLETVLSVLGLPSVLVGVGTLERLIASMDRHGVAKSVVIAGPPVAPNSWVLEQAAGFAGDRLIPVTTLPNVATDASERAWLEAFCDLADRGARGFKIHGNLEWLPPDHVAYRALFQVAEERDLFVILHTGCFHVFLYRNRRPAEPAQYEPLFRDFPKVRVCLAHMNRDHPERVWELMNRFEQLYTDTSWQGVDAVRRAVEVADADRILLGSDWPLLHDELQGESLDIIRRAVAPAMAERIGVDNAHRFLGEGP